MLGQTGGERRLNVAVTRARKKVVLMTSMPVGEVSDMLSTRRPPASPRDYLQAYLDYARAVSEVPRSSAGALLGRLVTERPSERDMASAPNATASAIAVEEFLRESRMAAVPVPNDGGAFGLDFAIEDPRTGLYAIGIECDAPRHRILETARAREVWRPGVLRRAVPHVHRVSSYAWMHTGDAERARLQVSRRAGAFSGWEDPMSGPKVFYVVTREELVARCEAHLRRLDAAIAEWTKACERDGAAEATGSRSRRGTTRRIAADA